MRTIDETGLMMVRRGRMIVGTIIAVNLMVLVTLLIVMLIWAQPGRLSKTLWRTGGKLLALYGLWRGVRWVHWLYVAGFLIGAGMFLYVAAKRPEKLPLPIAIPIAVTFAWVGGLLAFSPSVRAFHAWQRGEWDDLDESIEDEAHVEPSDLSAECACQSCGAEVCSDRPTCPYCGARLS